MLSQVDDDDGQDEAWPEEQKDLAWALATLGLQRGATVSDAKRAYRQKVRKLRGDFPETCGAAEDFDVKRVAKSA